MTFHERRYLRRADAIITEDQNTRGALIRMRIPAERIHLVPSGVDVERARAVSVADITAPWRQEGPIVGYIGRIDPRKGVQYLIEAMPQVRQQFPNAKLVLAGGSRHGYDVVIRQLIQRLELNDHVHILGRIDGDILPYYKLMDVIVIPSLSEGIPITLGEAMAARVPVVITRLPGVIPFVQPPHLVHWSDLASAESLAAAIISTLQDPQAAEHIEHAFTFISKYTWRAVAERHTEVYATVSAGAGQKMLRDI